MTFNEIKNLLNILNYSVSIQNNIRIWKLASLISLSRIYETNSLKRKIESFIGKGLSDENFENWVIQNGIDLIYLETWSTIKTNSIINTQVKDIVYFISKDPMPNNHNLFESFKVITSYLLNPIGDIPKLYLYQTKYISNFKLSNLDKNLSEYSFIFESIIKFFGLRLNNDTIKSITQFINDNINKINEIINIGTTRPRILGCGVDGCAFSLGNHLVLKIFKDKQLYSKTLESLNRLHKDPELASTEAMIYDVGELGKFKYAGLSITIYYSILEKMIPVIKLKHNIEQEMYSIIKYIVKMFYENKSNLKEIKSELEAGTLNSKSIKEELNIFKKTIAQEIRKSNLEEINKIESVVDLSNDWLESLIEEILVKYLTGRTDLHLGNLGLSKYKKFRYYDPYHKDHTSEIVYFND